MKKIIFKFYGKTYYEDSQPVITWLRSGVFIVNFELISHLVVFIVNFELVNASWV